MDYHFDYEEDVPSPLKSKEEAWLPGFYLGYTYKKKDDPYTRLFIEYTNADTGGTNHFAVKVNQT